MNEAMRNAIVERRQAKASVRNIARELGISRESVQRVLAQVAAERSGQAPSANMLLPPQRRKSQLDAYEPVLRELLARYPDMTSRRLFEELRARGFAGKYTIVRERVGLLRQRPTKEPVLRFETPPGAQAQMDYGVYDIDFTREGRRRVYLFSYVLGYSRRQYLRFVEAMDLPTTLREHVGRMERRRPATIDEFRGDIDRQDACAFARLSARAEATLRSRCGRGLASQRLRPGPRLPSGRVASSWLMKAMSSGPVMPSALAAQSSQRYGDSIAGRNFFPESSASSSRMRSMSSRNFRNMTQVSMGSRSKSPFRPLSLRMMSRHDLINVPSC